MLNCLLFTGKPLSDAAAAAILKAARRMIGSGSGQAPVFHDDCCGVVATEGRRVCLGCIAGVLCSADVEARHGRTKVSFIVREADLGDDDGPWQTIDLRRPAGPRPSVN
jgi:hypothetical protein